MAAGGNSKAIKLEMPMVREGEKQDTGREAHLIEKINSGQRTNTNRRGRGRYRGAWKLALKACGSKFASRNTHTHTQDICTGHTKQPGHLKM